MDDRYVFDQLHEALELEPNAGAYERFRSTFTNPTAVGKPRPLFRLRFSKMGFRLAAAMVAVVVIAIAVVAGILATHHGPTSYVDATQQKNEQAYVRLMLTDYNNFVNATSNHCNTIDDQGCAAAIQHLLPAMRKWVSDLAAFHTPPQYVILDGRLRAHLNWVVVDLGTATVAAQNRHDVDGFTLSMNAALYQRAWIDPASFTLEGTYPQSASSYKAAVALANRSLSSCINTTAGPDALACEHISGAEPCLGAAAQACADDIQSAETQLQNFIIAIAQNPPDSAQSAHDRQFESAMANADDLLLDMVTAQLNGDASRISKDETAYLGAINSAADASQSLVG